MVVIEKIPQCQRQAGIFCEGGCPCHKAGSAVIRCTDIIQYVFCRDLFQLNVAAFWRGEKTLFDFPAYTAGGIGKQCCKLLLKIILFVCLTDKIQHGQAFFVFGQTQAAAQLLQKHGQRFRGAQEQHSVHLGDIHTFVVNVHHEEESEFPGNQPLLGGVALLVRRVAGQCHRRDAVGIKVARHKLGMRNGNTEAQTFYLVDVRHIF